MLDCTTHRAELEARIQSIRALLDATHRSPAPLHPDISREARGLCVVLLHAAYERLLTSLCRSLLETARGLRVSNRRLKPGFQLFAAFPKVEAASSVGKSTIWREKGLDLVKSVSERRECTIQTDIFPDDGSYMKQSQVRTFCTLFDLGPPGPLLREVWSRLDTIVTERNGIAHGRLTADQVGRNYSIQDMEALVTMWHLRWGEFLDHAEAKASTRDFYRTPR